MANLRGSANYVWNMSDTLGSGATGAVYKARHKKTGELYAVKTFNDMSHMRPLEVQMREFDVMRKLQHENIVKLLAIEKESLTQSDVLVMELCTGGSLFNLLDDPENGYGVDEREFLCILNDVASGMQHLHKEGFVHRDIKPGNIMRYIREDGRSIYKLIDFGAARSLQSEEQFISLYGTEEYLYPDMYERAVLRRPSAKSFSAVVDLWSVGVTLYHVATGQLPFRPYGGRRNKETMYRITTEKAPGVISGVQNTEGGEIVWSKQLPASCRLSLGLKKLLTPLLAGLLECDSDRMMSFEDFFSAVKNISSKTVVHVFSATLACCMPLSIYIDTTARLTQFQELVADQADIAAQDQLMLFENHELEKLVKAIQPITEYPMTSVQNPIYLYTSSQQHVSGSSTDPVSLQPISNMLEMPTLGNSQAGVSDNLESDVLLAKNFCAVGHHTLRLVNSLIMQQQLVCRAAKMYQLVLLREIEHVRDVATEFFSLVEETNKRVTVLVLCHQQQQTSGVSSSAELNDLAEKFNVILEHVRGMKACIDKQYTTLNSSEPTLSVMWLQQSGCLDEHRCITKAEILVDALKTTLDTFKRNKSIKKMTFNDEQIHKFDKHKMKLNGARLTALLADHCLPNTQKIFTQFHVWFTRISQMQGSAEQLKSRLISVSEQHNTLTAELDQLQDSILGQSAALSSQKPPAVAISTRQPVATLSRVAGFLDSEANSVGGRTVGGVIMDQSALRKMSLTELAQALEQKLQDNGVDIDAMHGLVKSNILMTQELQRKMESLKAADALSQYTDLSEPGTLLA